MFTGRYVLRMGSSNIFGPELALIQRPWRRMVRLAGVNSCSEKREEPCTREFLHLDNGTPKKGDKHVIRTGIIMLL